MNRSLILGLLAASTLALTEACSEAPNSTHTEEARLEGETAVGAADVTRCFGTEPFWDLTITPTTIELHADDDVSYAHGKPTAAAGASSDYAVLYHGQTSADGQALDVVITRQAGCSDGMSNDEYAFSTSVIRGGALFLGCCK